MNMQCEQFEQILEQQDEGALPKPALAHLEDLRGVPRPLGGFRRHPRHGPGAGRRGDCSSRARVDFAAQPARSGAADPRPAGRLRGAQAAQAPAGGPFFSAPPLPVLSWRSCWPRLRRSATFRISRRRRCTRQLAIQQETSPVPSADSVFKEEVLTVGSDSIPGLQRQDTAVTDSIRRNLQIVDNFIAMCEKSVREQPDNQMAREYLVRSLSAESGASGHGHEPQHDGRTAVNAFSTMLGTV